MSAEPVVQPAFSEAVRAHIVSVRAALAAAPLAAIDSVVDIIWRAHRAGRHIYIVGNGGSAATASHFACDLSKATAIPGRPRLRVTSLTDNMAVLTAWANDSSYECVFAEQLRSIATPGDVLIAVSASGNSPNIVAALTEAQALQMVTVAFVGFHGGRAARLADSVVHIALHDYGAVEDCHSVVQHAITTRVAELVRG